MYITNTGVRVSEPMDIMVGSYNQIYLYKTVVVVVVVVFVRICIHYK